MSLEKITLENMFGLTENDGSKFEIEVPANSLGILRAAKSVYKHIFNYFSDVNNAKNFQKVLDIIHDISYSQYFTSCLYSYVGADLLNKYRIFNNENVIKKALEDNRNSDRDDILSIFSAILFFSCFEYSANEINGPNNKCYLYEPLESYDGYKLKKTSDNALLRFSKTLNCGWNTKTYSIYFEDSKPTINNISGLESLLTDGICRKDETDYLVFITKEEAKQFISEALSITGNYKSIDWHGEVNKYSFELNYGYSIYSKFIERIYDTLKKQSEYTQKTANYNSDENIRDTTIVLSNQFSLSGASANQKILSSYERIYSYAFDLLKKYIEILKDEYKDKEVKDLKKEFYKNGTSGYIERLINKIVGASNGGNRYEFAERTSLNIFDSENNGKLIRDNILKYAQSSGQKLKNNNGYIIETNSKSISKLSKNTTNCMVWEVCDSEDENEKMKIAKIIDRINTGAKFTDTSFYFYELNYFAEKNFNFNFEGENKEKIQERINELCKISGSIIYKACIFCLYNLKKTGDFKDAEVSKYRPDQHTYYYYQSDSSTYKLEKNFNTENSENADYNGVKYSDVSKLYNAIGKDLITYLNTLLEVEVKSASNRKKTESVRESADSFSEYVKNRFSDGYFTEKDYFYINDNGYSRIPVNSFIDIEFRVPKYTDNGIDIEWIPVTAMRSYNDNELEDIVFNQGEKDLEVHAGTYFESMELNDNGGVKEISLSLKSSNDMNLERIIYNSLSLDSKINGYNKNTSLGTTVANIEKIIKDNASSNFRVRFGYRDIASNDANNNKTTITSTNVSDGDFIDRAKIFKNSKNENYVKPVMVYPWTYFKITGLDSNIKDGEDTYNIKGVSSGSYILNNMTLCGIPSNFSNIATSSGENNSGDYLGTPKNVVGKLAKWIMMASADDKKDSPGEKDLTTARICFLGDKPGTIVSGVDTSMGSNEEIIKTDYKYVLKGNGTTKNDTTGSEGSVYLKGGNLESIESYFFNENNNKTILSAKNFNIKNDTVSISVKTILDNLIKWLPTRVYYIAKNSKYGVVAIYLPYESIYKIENFFEKFPHKNERITYQVIEADAHIYKGETDTANKNDENYYHKTYFIRMYYEGPGRSTDENGEETINSDYLRIYNYRSLQEQVIENIEISSGDAEFGNTISSVSMLGSGTPLIFTFSKEEGTMNEDAVATSTGKIAERIIRSDTNATTINQGQYSYIFDSSRDITPYFSLNNSLYVITDSKGVENLPTTMNTYTMEASHFFSDMQNKLYSGEMTILGDPFYYFDSSLEAGKYEIYLQMNRAEDQKTYKMIPSRYTGIYYIKGIKHNIDSSGKYTTTLSIFKRVFTGSDTSEKKS